MLWNGAPRALRGCQYSRIVQDALRGPVGCCRTARHGVSGAAELLAHAVADVVRHVDGVDGVDGERPRSWSSLLAVGADGSLARQQVRRHPACACCAEAHHHSESSLPSIARRLSREQVSQ